MDRREKDFKIGYVPYSNDLSQPGDRRRFPYFAERKDFFYEIADPRKAYDVILLTAPSNLTKWLNYKEAYPNTKFIFEMVDSLVFHQDLLTTLFKGVGRYALKREDRIVWRFQTIIEKWIRISDCVVCSNEVLRQYVLNRNSNAILSPDYLETEYQMKKRDFTINGKMKIAWEGLPSVLHHFLHFRDVLAEISAFCELHLITNSTYPVIPKLYYRNIEQFLKNLPIKTVFHEWDIQTHNRILTEMDCAIIPINRKNEFAWHKPANKLVSFWFCGLPTITTDTPAYRTLMDNAGDHAYCATKDEWVQMLRSVYDMSADQRLEWAERNRNFVQENYSDEKLDKIWFAIFNSLI